MKPIKIVLVVFLLVITPITVFAHSGGTDSNGGHRCWTDCEKYGYKYGEYHYHNTGLNTSNRNNNYYPTSNNEKSNSIGDFLWFGIVVLFVGIFIGAMFSDKKK